MSHQLGSCEAGKLLPCESYALLTQHCRNLATAKLVTHSNLVIVI